MGSNERILSTHDSALSGQAHELMRWHSKQFRTPLTVKDAIDIFVSRIVRDHIIKSNGGYKMT